MKILVEDEIKNKNLWKLMKKKEIQTSKQLATELITKEIYTDFQRKTRNTDEVYNDEEIKKLNIDTLAKKITAWLYKGICPSEKLLFSCCKYFDCSADYLIGLIKRPTHKTIKTAELTGLSDTAIKTLEHINQAHTDKNPNNFMLPLLDSILSSWDGSTFENFLDDFNAYVYPDYCVPVYHQTIDGKVTVAESKHLHDKTPIKIGNHEVVYKHYQYFAKEGNPDENIRIEINEDFMRAIALNKLEQRLLEMKNDIRKQS